jgi:glycosyltransferase involved in cell wall biosynthesis
VLEAFSVRTPVIVDAQGGALFENAALSGGGLAYRTDAELLWSIRRLVHDDNLRDELSHAGYSRRINEWSEAAHLDRYFELIATIRAGRASQGPHLSNAGARSRAARTAR